MVVLLGGSPISTEELWSSVRVIIGFLVTSLTKAHLPRLLSLAGRLGGSKLLPSKNDGSHCVLGDIQCCRHFLVDFPRSEPRHNPVTELYRQFLRPYGLVFALTCTVNCGTGMCLSNHVQAIEFTTGGFQSSWRNISRMINGNRTHLSSISSLIWRGLNTLCK